MKKAAPIAEVASLHGLGWEPVSGHTSPVDAERSYPTVVIPVNEKYFLFFI